MKTCMLDTNICSFIMRERPLGVLEQLEAAVAEQARIVVSSVTYYELLLGAVGKKASPKHATLVEGFVARLSQVLPWDRRAAEQSAAVHAELARRGTPIGGNDTMIAGHALAAGCLLVTNNTREFLRIPGLAVEDWGR